MTRQKRRRRRRLSGNRSHGLSTTSRSCLSDAGRDVTSALVPVRSDRMAPYRSRCAADAPVHRSSEHNGHLQPSADCAERPTFRPGSDAIDGFVWCRAMPQPPVAQSTKMGDASPAYMTAPATADLLLNPSMAVDRTNGWHLLTPLVCQLQDRRATIPGT
jgi:hypothetical protein